MGAPLREHPLARGKLADKASDFLSRAWTKGWLPPPDLEPQALWEMACKSYASDGVLAEIGGRRPEDVAEFRERFERLCNAVIGEADLNALGKAMAHGQLIRALKNRLAFGSLWTKQPELLATRLAPPIIVLGHMRSGTTRVHKLLAADPAHSHTRYCDAYHPLAGGPVLSRMISSMELAMLGALNPWLQSIHPMSAGEVEEELAWISMALHHSIYESQWHIPSYSAWSEAHGSAAIYREFARILRTDAGLRGIGGLPRILKVPAFTEDLGALLAQFPDARLVIAQRDLDAVHRSAVSLAANQMAVQSDTCDLGRIEQFWRHKIELRERRLAEALDGWTGPVARLDFDALGEDWEREMVRAYDQLGLQLTPRARAAMQALMAKADDGAHRGHARQLERFSRSDAA